MNHLYTLQAALHRVKMGTHYLTLHASATTRIPPCKENLLFELFYTCNGNVKDLYYTCY
jgi:hypothetical protein